jgi:RNA polymerase sigma-70 factor (ECF subfamily)
MSGLVPRGARLDRDIATEGFYQRIWPHRADVLRFARFLTRDVSVADDVAQDSLLKAFKSVGDLEPGANVRAWLLKIVRNNWLDRLRSQTRRRETSLHDLPTEPPAHDETATPWARRYEDLGELLEAFSDDQMIEGLLELPEEMRWTLLLIDVEGLTLAEAASVLNVPEGTVKSRCHRGRQMLRTILLPLVRPDVREES